MSYLLISMTGYLLGSLPTAYLILRKVKGIDITKEGTGNVGAMNSYEVTNSKIIGILVLLIDALKGLLSVYVAILFFHFDFNIAALALTFAVFSHCFNPWLKFKGGRGLATAAGGTILLFPILPISWLVIWVIIYVFRKDILLANIWAIIISAVLLFSLSDLVIGFSFPHAESISSMLFFASSLLIIIFIKHIEPLKELNH